MSARIIPFEDANAADVYSIEARLAPIDVGFDLRVHKTPVRLAADTTIASYADRDGRRMVVYGTMTEIAAVLRAAGYIVEIGD